MIYRKYGNKYKCWVVFETIVSPLSVQNGLGPQYWSDILSHLDIAFAQRIAFYQLQKVLNIRQILT